MTEIRYSKDHEWVRLDGDVAVVGITQHAADALGDLVYVETPEPGRDVTVGEACAVVESVKAASDVYAPLAGHVVENNPALADTPGDVNEEPEGKGWLFKLSGIDRAAFDALLDADAYAKLVEEA
jgi:glycine cleavage system H protein